MRDAIIKRIVALTDEQLELLIALFQELEEEPKQDEHQTSA